jgi:CBS-domain-containing membrane protein
MEVKRAEEIMIPLDAYPHIPYWFTLRQAIVELENAEFDINGRRSLPRFVLVFDEQYNLMGMVRRRDILRGMVPKFLARRAQRGGRDVFEVPMDFNLAEIALERVTSRMKQQAERRVSEVMIPIRATVEHDDHVMKVINEMVENNMAWLPVLKDKKVVGVVRSVEVFHEVASAVL